MSPLRDRAAFEAEEAGALAPFASHSRDSRGRVIAEPEHFYRTAYQRDRDRVLHSRAFRRLEYKTQVFVYHEGDHHRNRLTHTLEGAQIARTIARALRLNEDLAEAIVLAHDLGHTPFGHAGERVLAQSMREHGGFDHNRQSLRVVDVLEEHYPDFRGLNLSTETREGILKHGCDWDHPVPLPELRRQRSLEAQVADIADEIAYTNHDLDDGLQAGLLTRDQLENVALWREASRAVDEQMPKASDEVRHAQTIIALINELVTDLVTTSAAALETAAPTSVDAVRDHETSLIGFSDRARTGELALKRFLLEHLYQHPEVLRVTRKAEWIVSDIFRIYLEDPQLLPERVRARFDREGAPRAIADYVAGMTDRFATAEHKKLTDPHESL